MSNENIFNKTAIIERIIRRFICITVRTARRFEE